MRTKAPQTLVIKKLENVSKLVFRNYYKQITELIGNSHGIYALYDENELYYVGKSTDLKNRVKQHLRDRHLASWTHFSLYLVRNAEQINEIESLLIRIANPKGNTKKYKIDKGGISLLKQLVKIVKEKQKEELVSLFGIKKASRQAAKAAVGNGRSLNGLVSRKTALFRTYKGKEYKALLTPKGKIKIGSATFYSPTAAAKHVVKWSSVNGWRFWYIKDSDGSWTRLSDYRSS